MPVHHLAVDLKFQDTEQSRTSYHSYANLINVVHAELQLLERMSGPDSGLRAGIRLCEIAARAFRSRAVAAEHCNALTEFKSRIRTLVSGISINPKYEDDAAEARSIINEVIDDVDLRVQEAVARHGLPRTRTRLDSGDTESLLLAVAPQVPVQINASPVVPPGLLEAVGRLANALQTDGGIVIATAEAETVDAETTIELVGGTVSSPGEIPSAPPASFAAESGGPLPALLSLVYYLAIPNGAVDIDLETPASVHIQVK